MLGETKNSRLDGKEDYYVEEIIHSIIIHWDAFCHYRLQFRFGCGCPGQRQRS